MVGFPDQTRVLHGQQWQNSGPGVIKGKGKIAILAFFFKCALFLLTLSSRQSCQSFSTSEYAIRSRVLLDTKHKSFRGSIESSRTARGSKTEEQDSVSVLSSNRDTRAGQDGYSLLRQPLQRDTWDSSKDPKFKVPKNLNDDGTILNKVDSSWWSSKKRTRNGGTKAKMSPYNRVDGTASTVSEMVSLSEDQTLDLFQRSSDTLDFPVILRALREKCYTAPAKEIVDEASDQSEQKHGSSTKVIDHSKSRPKIEHRKEYSLVANSPQEVREQYEAVFEMQQLLDLNGIPKTDLRGAYYRNRRGIQVAIGNGNPPPLEGCSFDLEPILKICSEEGEVLEGPEILEISTMMNAMEDIKLWARALEKISDISRAEEKNNLYSSSSVFVEIPRIVNGIELNSTLQTLLEEAFDNNGQLSGKTFPALGQLRASIRSLKTDILQTLDSIVQLPSIKSKLALESGGPLYSEITSANGGSTGGRLVLPIDPKHASEIGIVHDSSRSGKTVYVEPSEIVGSTNELRQIERELELEEARVWRSLTEQVWNNQHDLRRSVQAVALLDLCVARCALGRDLEGVVPIVKDEGVITLRDAKHPVLLLRKIDKVVGSDISLGADGNQGLVLTGPNSGGKTVILKLLGLLGLMSRTGIPIPAANGDPGGEYKPRVDFFSPILADIGDIQSVDSDLSTFSGHMLVCREVLALAQSGNALVLMDELGSGTDPNQGVAIAQALLEALMDTGCRVAITTHYMQLKQLASSDNRFSVAGMQFVGNRPTYKLLPGVVAESYALAVAERLELPQTVISRANELLDSETRQMGDLIRDLEDQKLLIDKQVSEIKERKKKIAEMEYKMRENEIKLEKKMLTARRDEARKFAKRLEEKEQILEDVLVKLKSDPSRKLITKSWEDIKYVKRDAINEAENVPSVLKAKKNAANELGKAIEELVPLAEIRNRPILKEGDKLRVCKGGNLFGREAIVVRDNGKQIQVKVSGLSMTLKHTQLSMVIVDGVEKVKKSASATRNANKSSRSSKAVERVLKSESRDRKSSKHAEEKVTTALEMRTDANTIDVRGCYFEDAKDKVTGKISQCKMRNYKFLYVLHGHGSGGVLKSKLRGWLKMERRLIKRWSPADGSDGGDAFTKIELN